MPCKILIKLVNSRSYHWAHWNLRIMRKKAISIYRTKKFWKLETYFQFRIFLCFFCQHFAKTLKTIIIFYLSLGSSIFKVTVLKGRVLVSCDDCKYYVINTVDLNWNVVAHKGAVKSCQVCHQYSILLSFRPSKGAFKYWYNWPSVSRDTKKLRNTEQNSFNKEVS